MLMRDNERKKRTRFLAHLLIVLMFCTVLLPMQTGEASALTAPGNVTLKSVIQKPGALNTTTLVVKWYPVEKCSGYQVQYSPDRYFLGRKTKKVEKGDATKAKIRMLDGGTRYYVRVRAYKKKKKTIVYSGWTTYNNVPLSTGVKKQRVRSGLKKVELRAAAKQAVPGYDSLQGACYGRGYVYYVLNNRDTGRCKIVKAKLKNMKVVKVSGPLNVNHGNDITYNSRANLLVVSHSTGATKMVSVVSPTTLKVRYSKNVELPEELPGMPKKYRKYYNGFGAIAYNKQHDQYVVLLRGEDFHHLMILNSQFEPVRFLKLSVRAKRTVQGIDTLKDSILVGRSAGSGKAYNDITIYDWDGNFQSELLLGNKFEFETVFHTSNAFYLGYYTSYFKYKKGKGNLLQRDGYLFKVTNL